MYYINIAAGEAKKKKGYARFPDDFQWLRAGMETILQRNNKGDILIETTLNDAYKLIKQIEKFEGQEDNVMIFYDR